MIETASTAVTPASLARDTLRPWLLSVRSDSLGASFVRGLGAAMTYSDLDRRVTKLETRVSDVETCHSSAIYGLTRDVRALKIVNYQLVDGMNNLGRGVALMMERMGIEPIQVPVITMPTEADIDASFEEDC
jgi:hypothetical protein